MRFAANSQPVRHFSPRALVRLAAGLALALVYRGASSGRSRRRSRASHARYRASCSPVACPFPARPSWRSAPTVAEVASTSSEQNGSYVLRLRGAGNLSRSARRSPRLLRRAREATLAAERLQRAALDLVLALASRAAVVGRGRRLDFQATYAGRSPPAGAGPSTGSGPGRWSGSGHAGAAARPRALRQAQGTRRVPAARRRHERRRRTGRRRGEGRLGGENSGRSCSSRRGSHPTRRPRP